MVSQYLERYSGTKFSHLYYILKCSFVDKPEKDWVPITHLSKCLLCYTVCYGLMYNGHQYNHGLRSSGQPCRVYKQVSRKYSTGAIMIEKMQGDTGVQTKGS